MSKLVMNIKNEQNMKAMVEWCKQYHIEFQIIEDNQASMPQLVDESANESAPSPVTKKSTKKGEDFPKLADKPDDTVGIITRYGKLVRNWEVGFDGKVGGYTTDKARYATKKAIQDAGATWDNEQKAYAFKKVSDAKAFMKTQTERMKEIEQKKLGKALVK